LKVSENTIVIGGRNPFSPGNAVLLGTGDLSKRYVQYLNTVLNEKVTQMAMADRPIMPGTKAQDALISLGWLDEQRAKIDKAGLMVNFLGVKAKDNRRLGELAKGFTEFMAANKASLENISYLVNPRPMNLDGTADPTASVSSSEVQHDDEIIIEPEDIVITPSAQSEAKTVLNTVFPEDDHPVPKPTPDLIPGDVGYFSVKK